MNLRDLRLRLATLLAWRRAERELDDELAFHMGIRHWRGKRWSNI